MVDNKTEKYFSNSPYNYALNNPILFLDPDGNDVFVYYMGKDRMKAFETFMRTESGREFISNFLKDGEKVKLVHSNGDISEYALTGSGDGKYSSSTLNFGTIPLPGAWGRTDTFHPDGSKLLDPVKAEYLYETEGNLSKLQKDKRFVLNIPLNSELDQSADEWAITIGHEVFLHAVDDTESIQGVINALTTGKFESLLKLATILQSAATSTDEDHKNKEKNRDYQKYLQELKRNKNEEKK